MEREVTLMEMLEARESRANRQRELLDRHRCPVVSFTLNIAGPVKNGPVIRRAFREGLLRLEDALAARGLCPLHQEEVDRPTGCEALWAVDGPARTVKELCAQIEDRDPLGRLFDLDVLDPEGGKWDREALGLPPRPCLVCGKAGKGCASRRLHPVEEIQGKTQTILRDFFAEKDRKFLAAQGARALLYEVCTTPKPGLVDRHNNGSHKDMDVFTFLDSTAALLPYLERAAAIGQETAHMTPEEILAECGRMSAPAAEGFFAALTRENARTAGERLYVETGARGVRGEAAEGFPAVLKIGLPALKAALDQGAGLEEAGTAALLALTAGTADTNLFARGGLEGQRWAARQAGALLEGGPRPDPEAVRALDRAMIQRNLSPGGCADLLAITYFLYFMWKGSVSPEGLCSARSSLER